MIQRKTMIEVHQFNIQVLNQSTLKTLSQNSNKIQKRCKTISLSIQEAWSQN